MEKDAQISVAMCTYNGEKYLLEQLESIAAQTIKPAELVVCDDGSTDQTVKILHKFAASAPFPVTIHINQERLGVGRNFFKAIRLCTSDWVVLCDQDDVWLPDRIAVFEKGISIFGEAKLLLTDGILVDEHLRSTRKTVFSAFNLSKEEINWINSGKAELALIRHVFVTGAGMAVSRKMIEKLPEPSVNFLHDEWLAWLACPFLRVIEQSTFLYRQHHEQQTGIDGSFLAPLRRALTPRQGSTMTIAQGIIRTLETKTAISQLPATRTSLVINLLDEKLEFLNMRAALPDNRLSRVFRIFFKIGIFRYLKLSSGIKTIVKDVFWKGRL